MDWNLFALFCALNVVNVVIQTAKSLVTIKCGKWAAAAVNAIAYGLYTIVLIYMTCELDLWLKVIVVATANFIGVYVVKVVEDKMRKDKLWKVEATIPKTEKVNEIFEMLDKSLVPYNYVDIQKYFLVNCYCSTQAQSKAIKSILNQYSAKYFVAESKTL